MNFQDQIQQIFGTTDIHELKQISRDADNYRCLNADMNNSSISEKKKNTGRKNSFTEEQLEYISQRRRIKFLYAKEMYSFSL